MKPRSIWMLLIATSLFAAQPLQASLIAFYTFEGNADDVSGNGNNGIVSGAIPTISGFEGSAYQFDGLNDFIELSIDVNPSVLPQLTWGAWVNADANDGVRQVLSHDNGLFDRSLGMDFRAGGGSPSDWSSFTGSNIDTSGGILSSGVDVTIGNWVFLAAVYDEVTATVHLHVDGLVVTALDSEFGSSHNALRIGSNPLSDGIEFFAGQIDNVFIYDEALSASRIEEIRAGGAEAILVPVQEPISLALIVLGLAGLGFISVRR